MTGNKVCRACKLRRRLGNSASPDRRGTQRRVVLLQFMNVGAVLRAALLLVSRGT